MTRLSFIITIALLFSCFKAEANWTVSSEDEKVFIENKGQFSSREFPSVIYAYDNGRQKIFFLPDGIVYQFLKIPSLGEGKDLSHEEMEKEEAQVIKRMKDGIPAEYVVMHWDNANPGVLIEPEEKVSFNYSYTFEQDGKRVNANNIPAFRKIVYRNLYPHIDVEYTFHPQTGIKYSLILHPGADFSRVKMKYKGAKKVFLDNDGNVHLTTEEGDIIDHAPQTWYEKNHKTIESSFLIHGTTLGFNLQSAQIASETIVIDPWTCNPNFTSVNFAYKVITDVIGNVYAFGGDWPIRLKKYNASGALQYNYTNATWYPPASRWFGGLTAEPNGTVYICDGGSNVDKISPSGAMLFSSLNLISMSDMYETYQLYFDCAANQLVGCGGEWFQDVVGQHVIPMLFRFDMNTGQVIDTTSQYFDLNSNDECRMMTRSPNGNYYFLTFRDLVSTTPQFGLNYAITSTFNFPYNIIINQGIITKLYIGFDNIIADCNNLFISTGNTIDKRNLANGNNVASATIPGGAAYQNAGIARDNCGNIYVGSSNQVHKFDQNLNLISSVTVQDTVYDIAIGAAGEIVVVGQRFVQSVAFSTCNSLQCQTGCSNLSLSISSVNNLCVGDCNGTATVSLSGGTPPYTYSWSNGQTTATATGLCAGDYYVITTDAAGAYVLSAVTITQPPPIGATASASATTINAGGNTTLSATGSGTYNWVPATGLSCNTCQTTTASPSVTTEYCVIVTDASGCTDSACVHVAVLDNCEGLFVPNFFSPNGDGNNDVECVYGGCFESMKFSIYDRWGEKVFETTDQSVCWDGTYRGQRLDPGVYVYYIEGTRLTGLPVKISGNITLGR